MKFKFIALAILVATLTASCSSDKEVKKVVVTPASSANEQPQTTPPSSNEFGISLSNDNVLLNEGTSVTVTVNIDRPDGNNQLINLAVQGVAPSDTDNLNWQFSQTKLTGTARAATVTFSIGYSALPIQRQVRSLRILGTSDNNQTLAVNLRLEIAPTTLPDVYLLVGQSNMVGYSEENAKNASAGQIDAPNERIKQLNVTGNDFTNFTTIASFTDINSIAAPAPRLTTASDPLHNGYNSNVNGKNGTRIGLGMSFAKRAVNDTSATIYLVPTAWSDTGFCKRTSFRGNFEGKLGWNPKPSTNPALSGTLLHDRAIARANLVLEETGGILRGILWHQGEADSDSLECANLYSQNIQALVASLRTNIKQDARGPSARGPNANVPFVVGTMSKGSPYDYQPEPKLIVDGVHRNIQSVVPFSAFVNNDDLVPPAYPCGEGDCIHFGSTSYREMGSRYYDFLRNAAQP